MNRLSIINIVNSVKWNKYFVINDYIIGDGSHFHRFRSIRLMKEPYEKFVIILLNEKLFQLCNLYIYVLIFSYVEQLMTSFQYTGLSSSAI